MKSWTVTVEEDGILSLPQDLLDEAGWKEGDVLDWTDNKNGTWSLSKKEEHSKHYYDTDRNK